MLSDFEIKDLDASEITLESINTGQFSTYILEKGEKIINPVERVGLGKILYSHNFNQGFEDEQN